MKFLTFLKQTVMLLPRVEAATTTIKKVQADPVDLRKTAATKILDKIICQIRTTVKTAEIIAELAAETATTVIIKMDENGRVGKRSLRLLTRCLSFLLKF